MNKKLLLLICLCSFQVFMAQQRSSGIKVLVKDKETGFPMSNDTIVVSTNDTIMLKIVSDENGYLFLNRNQGRYDVIVGRKGYQTLKIFGIIVGEAKTAYLTMELSNRKVEKIKEKKKKGGVKLKMRKN